MPVTLLLWFAIINYGFYYSIEGLVYIFNLHWFVVLVLGGVFIGLLSLVYRLPMAIVLFVIGKLYKNSWLSVVLHSLVGLIACVNIVIYYYNSDLSLSLFWNTSKLKTILLFFPAIGVLIGCLWAGSFGVLSFKLNEEKY